MNNTKEINLYIQDRQYIIRWQNDENQKIHEVLQFIFNEIQSKYKLTNFTLINDEQSEIEQNFDVILKYQNIYINQQQQQREFQNIVNIQDNNVIIEKFKVGKKLEQVNYKLQTIININNQYRDTIQQLKDNKAIIQQKSSIERSAQTFPVTRNVNNIVLKQKEIQLKEYSIEEVKQNGWMVIQNSIYNINIYIDKHPGGREQIMRGIGRDATDLFMQNHPWINYHYILEQLHVGFLKK